MTRKIFLEGELGAKFGSVFEFSGPTVSDAIKCVAANRPDFRKYLIEAHEQDIGFVVEIQGNNLEDIKECLLPISKGDIIMTPVPAGSKSGGAKILTAIAIASLFFFNPLGTSQAFFALNGQGLFTAGVSLAAASIATNLAISGLQQLMAPDPSVDENEESYLFNGNQRTVVEGDPVPVLYGELAVPGFPISFEVSNDEYPRVTEYSDSEGNTFSYPEWAEEGNYSEDRTNIQGISSNNYLPPNESGTIFSRSQNMVFTDIISEGPIYGFVNGGNSVLLDNVPLTDSITSSKFLSQTSITFTISGTNVAITKNGYQGSIKEAHYGYKNLLLRDVAVNTAATATEWTDSTDSEGGIHGVEITATGFFDSSWVNLLDNGDEYDPASNHVIRLTKNGETYFEGFIVEVVSANVARCIPILPSNINLAGISTFDVSFDPVLQITSISANETTATLASNPLGVSGTYNGDLTGQLASSITYDYATFTNKESNTSAQLRTGTQRQPVLKDPGGTGIGSVSGVYSSGVAMQGKGWHSDTQENGDNSVLELQGRANILAAKPSLTAEVDELKINIQYPALFNRSPSRAELLPGSAWWAFYVRVKRNKTDSWPTEYVKVLAPRDSDTRGLVMHSATSSSPISAQETIDLTPFKPFYDFEVKIERFSDDDVAYSLGNFPGQNSSSGIRSDYTGSSTATVGSVTYVVKEPLNYPFTALAKVTTNSKRYNSIPNRSYHCKGKKVLVPSNYVTRDEAADGVASYNRAVSGGNIQESYQDWDGQFRTTKVYTNNPAWIFYDLLINKRYGLGRWIDPSDIDIYALYRISQFCDELVTDGDGGLEPRFTSNIYLTKATDAYKVLKDMATTFNSILYWMDGKAVLVPDQAGDPVYNFTPSNVIDGSFIYETTGDRTRANQVVVTWNNPASNYLQEALIVEDRENIISTGKIIPEEAVAYGATTEGQALRYGRWKLWTARNQTELVSFKTALNAAFLMPGDIINVQDPYRYPAAAQYSGRVSSGSDQTTINLDREIDLQVLSTYQLSIVINTPGAFLAQVDPVTINGITYTNGDLIPNDRDGNPILTETQANNLLDDTSPGNYVITRWAPYTRVETLDVTTTSGPNISQLVVGSPGFTTSPTSESVWVLTERLDGDIVEGSTKAYKILSIAEESKNEYSIVAVEHYNQKFTSIDEDFVLAIEDPIFPYPKPTDDVPAPRNVYVVVNNTDEGEIEDDATLYWDYPVNDDGTRYEYVSQFAIIHNVPGVQNPLVVGKDITSISGVNIPQGTYSVGVSTISISGNYSWPTTTYMRIDDWINNRAYRIRGYVLGGISSTPFVINALGVARFIDPVHDFTAPGNPEQIFTYNGEHYEIDCSGIPQKDFRNMTGIEETLETHYIYFDYDGAGVSPDTSPPSQYFKLVQYRIDDDLKIEYLFDTGDGSVTYEDNWVLGTGTISIEANSNKVVGDGTAFTTELAVGDHIAFTTSGSPGGPAAAKIAFIVSDTDVRLDRSFSGEVPTSSSFTRTLMRVDKNRDCAFAAIRNSVNMDMVSPEPSPPTTYENNFLAFTDKLDINPSYEGIDSENSTFSEKVLGPTSLMSVSNRDYLLQSYKYINSSTSDTVDITSPDTSIQVPGIKKSSFKGIGKFKGQEVDIVNGSDTLKGVIEQYDGDSGTLTVSSVKNTGTTIAEGATIALQPNMFDIDIYGRIRSSSDGYAEFAKATQLASIGIDFQTTSDSNINFSTIALDGTVDFILDDDFTESICDKQVLAVYNFLQGATRLQYYVIGTVNSWTAGSPKGTLSVLVDGFEGTGENQGTWEISILQEKLSLSRAGDLVVTGDIKAFCCSDEELKTNLVPILNPLQKLDLIHGYTFEWNEKATQKGTDVGVLAQEIQQVLPEVVKLRDNGYLGVEYAKIVPLLIESIKELKREIEELKNAR